MRVSNRSLAAVAALLFAAACSDSATAPRTSSPQVTDRAPSFDVSSSWGRSQDDDDTFTLTSKGGTFLVDGLFSVTFPKNSVCDPARSKYGPSEWNKDCITLSDNQKIVVTATLRVTSAGVAVDFQPALRFDKDAGVTISTDVFAPIITSNRDFLKRNPAALRPLAMYYSSSLGASKVADYLIDPSLVTHIDMKTGRVWRIVWHFSGYSITSGESCDPNPGDPDCISMDNK